MLITYIKLGIRNLLAQKSYSIINIIGLSIGIAAFLIIFLNIQYELGYNKTIPNADKVYRCVEIQQAPGVGEQHVAVTMGPLANALVSDFPEIEKAVRILYWGPQPIKVNNQTFDQEFVVFATPEIFDIMGVKLSIGDTASALKDLNSIILSEKVASKIFGSVDSVVGNMVSINDQSFKVTGIMEDQEEQSSFRLEAIIPYDYMETRFGWLTGWGSNSIDTYIRVNENTDIDELTAKFPEFINKYTDNEESDWPWSLYLQPVTDIHLKSGHIKFQVMNYNQGNIVMIYAFSIIAALIILLACINFINISIAQSVRRAKEVGIRKVMGAEPGNLMNQFLGESLIITFISLVIALVIVYSLLPVFNNLLSMNLYIDFVNNWIFNFGLLAILLIVSTVAGIYPAFYLSRFNPLKVLKSGIESNGGGSGVLTKSLVVFQFVIAIGMIFSINVVYDQYNYALNKDLGINYNDVVSINLYNKNDSENVTFLKNEFLLNSNIRDVALVSNVNGVAGTQRSIVVNDSAQTRISVRMGYVDYNYFNMMEIPVIAGRNFSKDFAMDDSIAVIVNRAAVEYLKWDEPIGKQFLPFLDTVSNPKVIGVIEDYNYYSIHSKIEPAVYAISPQMSRTLAVKINAINQAETIEYMESVWNKNFPDITFNYNIATEMRKREYRDEESTTKIFSMFTLLSIVISCLGLYGLTALIIERKSKEIGVRKVFGGSVYQIVGLLMTDFLFLVLIAGLFATPIAWYLMDIALESFAYHIQITWIYALKSVLIATIIAASTIVYHAYSAATSDPVKTLKYE